MPNTHVQQRLAGIQSILIGVHQAGSTLSTSSRGQERQEFIDAFLANVLPPIYRFGTGDATDTAGRRSGQLDVVVEYPISPSLPAFGGASATRLYLAESIAAVVEVKSNVSAQWQQAQRTAAQLAPLRRKIGAEMVMGGFAPGERIPLFVTGYTGWKNVESVKEALEQAPDIAGILVVDSGIFVSSAAYGSMTATGPWALWGLISILHLVTNALQAASTNPFAYAQ